MLLAIDIGNTHVVLGVYRGEKLVGSWRLQSDQLRSVDEYAMSMLQMLEHSGVKPKDISTVILGCVVPTLLRVFTKLSRKYFGQEPLVVGPGLKTGMEIECDDPRTVGADRVVNAVAGKALYGAPCVIVDFGTATTFDVVNSSGVYEGGVISPGILIAAEALHTKAALLPSVELTRPSKVIGKNTRDSMLSGMFFGYVSLVDGILERIISELGSKPSVIATGGLARGIAPESQHIEHVESELTLRGLQLVASLNS